MWVVTVFHNMNDIRIFEYPSKAAATEKIKGLHNAILSYTN